MLDLFFKKYVWIANAALVFAAAWLAAKTVNTVAGALIRLPPKVDLAASAPAPIAPPAPTSVPAERLYALIGQKPPAPPPVASDATAAAAPPRPQNCTDGGAAPQRTTLRAQLIGGVLADDARFSSASILDLNTRETRVYGVGDAIQGARLLEVVRIEEGARDASGAGFKVAAVVCNAGLKEFIDFEGGAGGGGAAGAGIPSVPPIATAPLPPGGPALPAGTLEGVRKVGDTQYEVQRSVIDNTLNNMSAYSSIGIENGDVIQRINGYEINSPDKALEVYQKLRSSAHVTLDVERNGRPMKFESNVSGP
jgi:general secretion pathway protein C